MLSWRNKENNHTFWLKKVPYLKQWLSEEVLKSEQWGLWQYISSCIGTLVLADLWYILYHKKVADNFSVNIPKVKDSCIIYSCHFNHISFTIKVPITAAAGHILIFFFLHYFSEKIRFDNIMCIIYMQMVHMTCQLFISSEKIIIKNQIMVCYIIIWLYKG